MAFYDQHDLPQTWDVLWGSLMRPVGMFHIQNGSQAET